MKIDIIIPSKNRACQLQLLLRSIEKYFKNVGKIFIIYKATDGSFQKGYDKLMGLNPNLTIEWIPEGNFGEQYKDVLTNRMKTDYFLGISDDCVFLEETVIPDNFKLNGQEAHLSLRLSEGNTYCQPGQFDMESPLFQYFEPFISWDWTKASRGDYAYPSSPDSNVWDRKYYIERINQFPINTLRDVEIGLDNHRDPSKPFMLSFKEIKLISIASNCVWEEGWTLPNMGVSLEMLNQKYLDGYQISMDNIVGKTYNSCHIFADYQFERA
jgi:hypothetical protein